MLKKIKMPENKKNPEEEIDLGNLFKVIGKGINNLITSFRNVFIGIFHYFIILLIFFKRNIKKLVMALIIGAIVGFVIEYFSPKIYTSELIVETNFGSGVQLYKQINYLNELVKKKDTVSLASALGIKSDQAAQLKRFKISAYQPNRNLYHSYDQYLENTDTVFSKGIKIEDFKKRLDEYDYRYHEIVVKSKSKTSFKLLTSGIRGLIENNYFNNRRDLKKKEIEQELHVLQKNLSQIDSLRLLYKEVAIKEAENHSNSSTIEFTQKVSEKNKNDIELFKTSNNILEEIRKLNEKLIKNENIINVISNFGDVGILDSKITNRKYFQFALLSEGMMLLIILLFQLNKYLSNYKKPDRI